MLETHLITLDTLGYSVINVNMKDIKKLKKDDFIKCAEELKLNDLRKLFNFTHMNIETGEKLKPLRELIVWIVLV